MMMCLFAPACQTLAQGVITSTPQTSTTPPAVQERQNDNPMQVFAPSGAASSAPLQLGPVTVHPHVDYQFLYGTGIQSSPGQQQNTIVQQLSPGILFNLGDHWALDYTPTVFFYSSSSFRDTVDHSAQLSWGMAYSDWFFSASQGFSFSSDPSVETAAQTDQQTYSTALNASYQFNDTMSLDLGLSQNLNYFGNGTAPTNLLQNLSSSRSWSTMDWLNYQFWPRFNVGIGVGAGYSQQDGSPDSINEQYQARANWRATDKISFQLNGGLQDQQYLSGGAGSLLTPIFGAAIQYQPFEQTKLSLSANRSVSPSYFQSQVTESTAITADLNQRLLGKLYLDLSGGYIATKYVASVSGASTSRHDDGYTFNARLTYPFLKMATASVFYTYSKNSSSQSGFTSSPSGFDYSSTQIGFEVGFRY